MTVDFCAQANHCTPSEICLYAIARARLERLHNCMRNMQECGGDLSLYVFTEINKMHFDLLVNDSRNALCAHGVQCVRISVPLLKTLSTLDAQEYNVVMIDRKNEPLLRVTQDFDFAGTFFSIASMTEKLDSYARSERLNVPMAWPYDEVIGCLASTH